MSTPLTLPTPYLSYSQVSTYLQCPRRYEQAYILRERGPTSATMAFGTAVHKGVETAIRHQLEHGAPIAMEALQEAVFEATSHQLSDVQQWDDVFADAAEDKARFHRWAQDMTCAYVRNRLPQLKPVASESHLRVMLDGRVPFHAVVDIIEEYPDADMRVIRDIKVTGKVYPPQRLETSLQLSIYAYLTGAQAVGYELFVRPKGPRQPGALHSQPQAAPGSVGPVAQLRPPEQLLHAANLVVEVAEQISKGNFPRTDPGSWACSSRWCPAYRQCRGPEAVGRSLKRITIEPLEVDAALEHMFADVEAE